jgi:uncharacterized membrane protein YdjX (TVP38/TMEM64 family)
VSQPSSEQQSDPVADEEKEFPSVGELPSLRGLFRKGLVIVLVALVVAVVLHYTRMDRLIVDLQEGKSRIDEWGWAAPLVFTGMTAFLVAIGVPRLTFCFVGGLGFGFVQGLIWSQLGTLLGAYLTYLFARYLARSWVLQRIQGRPRLRKWFSNPTVLSVFLVRQVPVGGVFLNLALGVSAVRSLEFLVGSLLGFLPEAVLVTLVGSGLGKDSPQMMLLQIGIIALCLLTAGWWLWNYPPLRTFIRNKWKTDL